MMNFLEKSGFAARNIPRAAIALEMTVD